MFKGPLYYYSSVESLGHENQLSYAHRQIRAKSPQVPTSIFITHVYEEIAAAGLNKNKTVVSL